MRYGQEKMVKALLAVDTEEAPTERDMAVPLVAAGIGERSADSSSPGPQHVYVVRDMSHSTCVCVCCVVRHCRFL